MPQKKEPVKELTPEAERELLLEHLSRAIATCEAMHNDSRTPLEQAVRLMDHIRNLHRIRRALRQKAFEAATASKEYAAAIEALKKVHESIKAQVIAHGQTMAFVNAVAQATTAVIDLAIAVGAFV
jgi:hypothetical protein